MVKEREEGAEALKMAQTAVYEYCNGPHSCPKSIFFWAAFSSKSFLTKELLNLPL